MTHLTRSKTIVGMGVFSTAEFLVYRKVLYESRGLCALFRLFGQASIRDRFIFKTGLYSRQVYIQDRFIFKTGLCVAVVQLLAAYTVQSMHAKIQHPCFLYMTSIAINAIKIRFCKPRLLFES